MIPAKYGVNCGCLGCGLPLQHRQTKKKGKGAAYWFGLPVVSHHALPDRAAGEKLVHQLEAMGGHVVQESRDRRVLLHAWKRLRTFLISCVHLPHIPIATHAHVQLFADWGGTSRGFEHQKTMLLPPYHLESCDRQPYYVSILGSRYSFKVGRSYFDSGHNAAPQLMVLRESFERASWSCTADRRPCRYPPFKTN